MALDATARFFTWQWGDQSFRGVGVVFDSTEVPAGAVFFVNILNGWQVASDLFPLFSTTHWWALQSEVLQWRGREGRGEGSMALLM